MKAILIFLAVLYLATGITIAEQSTKFSVITKDQLGFREGKEVYSLGMKISDFLSKFGPAEKSLKDKFFSGYLANTTTYFYVNDGLMVTANKDGVIIGFIFYLLPSKTMRSASVTTDTGVVTGFSAREIIKLHGEPFKKEEFTTDKFEEMKLYYKYADLVLSFTFDHGLLQSISMNSGYLPYIAK
jgi:hypothetical protein